MKERPCEGVAPLRRGPVELVPGPSSHGSGAAQVSRSVLKPLNPGSVEHFGRSRFTFPQCIFGGSSPLGGVVAARPGGI